MVTMHIVFHYYLETLRLDNSTLSIQHWDYRNAFLYSLIQANDFFWETVYQDQISYLSI